MPGVGIYLVDISAGNWARDECAPLLDGALAEATKTIDLTMYDQTSVASP